MAGGGLGGRGPALPPGFCPSPWLLLRSGCHSSPLVPWKLTLHSSCPCLLLPGNSHLSQSQGRGGTGEDGQEKGAWGSVHPPSQDPQNKATDSVILLQFCSFSSLSPTRCQDCTGAREEVSGRAGVPERASTWHASEATEALPHCVLPHGAVFRDSLRQRIQILPQSRN